MLALEREFKRSRSGLEHVPGGEATTRNDASARLDIEPPITLIIQDASTSRHSRRLDVASL